MPIFVRAVFLLCVGLPSELWAAGGWQADGFHVFPGENIQAALDQAARSPTNKVVRVHAGVYRPTEKCQALIWFNALHSGVRLEAVGEVTLTAANPELSGSQNPAHPAVVNHVIYFGDGVSEQTTIEGFKITGANHFVTTAPPEIETSQAFKKDLFFYADGGAIKIFGRSYPTLRGLEIMDNYASPCAGGISIQHQGHGDGPAPRAVRIENCVFLRNHSQITGAAVDLLPGSSAVITNCLFVANVANLGVNYISPHPEQPEFTNSAPLTVFPGSRAVVQRCTFQGNRNGADDLGRQSVYQDCIFWRNDLGGAFYPGERYALDIEDEAQVQGCSFGDRVLDPHQKISRMNNVLRSPDPKFDSQFRPTASEYRQAGFRPQGTRVHPVYSSAN